MHQMLAQRPGGWPLTMFLTPDGAPFFGGTSFPKEPRYNLPGFPQLLERVAQIYREHRDDIGRQNETIVATFERLHPGAPAHHSELTAAPIDAALRSLKTSFDSRHGGFGGAPKFPHPAELEFCLRRSAAAGDGAAGRVATYTLERMALGGIYGQLGGGFPRYSVDAEWMIPHFGQLLYHNGPLQGGQDLLASGRKKLFEAREKRVHPGRDEKVLVSWNALMIAGMARAAVVFGRDDWLASAKQALGFIRAAMWKNGRLLATYK